MKIKVYKRWEVDNGYKKYIKGEDGNMKKYIKEIMDWLNIEKYKTEIMDRVEIKIYKSI